jgi:uncharacterized protein (TIGR02145 family)
MIKVRQNLRKMVATAICLAVSSMMFSSCGQSAKRTKVNLNSETKQGAVDLSRQDEGVVINGVKWATRNIDKPSTFAANPEDAGMFYQWNRRVGWSTTDPMINSDGGTNWNGTDSEGIVWKKSNDPSPIGWRVPTFEEINTLLDTDKVSYEWTTENGINGGRFTDKVSNKSIFLPATGDRAFGNSGELNISKEMGSYWSSTPSAQQGISFMSQLRFSSVQAGLFGAYRSYGFPVRCVAE